MQSEQSQPGQPAGQYADQDKLLTAKGTTRKLDKKGRDVLALSLSQEQAAEFIEELGKALEASEGRGIKMTIHTGKKEGPRGQFDSSFFFVKATQQFGMNAPAVNGAQPTRWVAKKLA